MSIQKMTEFTIQCPHRPGEMTRVLDTLARAGVNVQAFCGYGQGDKASLMLVPDDEKKTSSTLTTAGITFQTNDVIAYFGDSGSGKGASLGRKLSDAGVNIDYAYASTTGQGDSMFVFATKDVDKALDVLS